MKELIDKLISYILQIWNGFAHKKILAPTLIGLLLILGLFVLQIYLEKEDVLIKRIFKNEFFYVPALLIGISALATTLIFLLKELLVNAKMYAMISGMLILISLGAGIYIIYGLFVPSSKIKIVFHLSNTNYNKEALVYLFTILNKEFNEFEFSQQNGQIFPETTKRNITENESDVIFSKLQDSYENANNDLNSPFHVILTSAHIEHNYFSLTRCNKTIISTYDWSNESFNKGDSLAVFEYIFNSIITNYFVSKCSGMRIHFHPESETNGCIFDYNKDKVEVLNEIKNAWICPKHEKDIRQILVDDTYAEVLELLKMKWLNKESVKNMLKDTYDIQINNAKK